ncbi:MAG: hypothetical protein NXI22_11810 [bacterium]|nr:hypothetical protein [bacterium]
MIAVVEQQSRARTGSAPTFEELLPAIRKRAAVAFRTVPASEREDLVAEVVANAYTAYQRLVERGRADVAYATPLAMYAVKQIRSGRRIGTRLNSNDVTSKYAQRVKGIKVEQLNSIEDSDGQWQCIVVEDKTAGPADIAATRLDFSVWLEALTPRVRRIAKRLATGETTKDVAHRFEISQGRVSQIRSELRKSWYDFQGELAVA